MTQVSLLITSGNGPAECQQAVAGILGILQAEAAANGFECDVSTTASKHGLMSVVLILNGKGASDFAKRWCGTVLWRAKSSLRPHHKRANWFIGVFELPPAPQAVDLKSSDLRFESFRAGGPGGQHQNTTDSAVRATHIPTGMTVVAREARSQHRNKALAMERLQALMTRQSQADRSAMQSAQNQMHMQLERGNPVRSFKGAQFKEEKL